MAMHYGTGALVGALRGIMAAANLRGPRASLMHTAIRLNVDQIAENATGVGAPPWTWPRDEQMIDVAHKAVYALATGAIVDHLIPASPCSSSRRQPLAPGCAAAPDPRCLSRSQRAPLSEALPARLSQPDPRAITW